MKQVNDKYMFPKYCKKFKIRGNKLLELLQNEDVFATHILANRKKKTTYFINESINSFLNCLTTPKSFKELLDTLNISNNEADEGNKELVRQFLDVMIKREIIEIENSSNNNNNKQISNFPEYNILRIFKDSKYGTICLAQDVNENSKVILKFLNFYENSPKEFIKERRNCFKQEFDIMLQVSEHPLICSLKSINKKKFVAVLEFVEGKTLKELIKGGELQLREKLRIVNQIIEVLSYIHQNEIIYGDVHADQFIIDSNLNLKLIDFSLSYYNNVNVEEQMMRRGGISYYIDPESVNSNAFVKINEYIPNFQSEIYRIGILLYFLIYEHFPFESFSWKKQCELTRNVSPEFNTITSKGEIIPANILQILKRSLQKEPFLRYSSAIEIKELLQKDVVYTCFTEKTHR